MCFAGTAIALVILFWSQQALGTMLPAIVLRRVDPLAVLQRGSLGQVPRVRAGRVLLAFETALGIVLVAGAAVTARSFVTLASADLGFDRRDLFLINMRPPAGATADADRTLMLDVMSDLSARTDVVAVGSAPYLSVLRTGQSAFGPEGPPCCRWPVTQEYLETIQIPVAAGRLFTESDFVGDAAVTVLNELAAERLWPGVPAGQVVGRTVQFDGEPTRQVVGVVGDTRRAYDVALLVAMVGLYAAAGFDVASRQRELGVRLALGASRSGILWLVVADACRPVIVGCLAGGAPCLTGTSR